MSQTLQKPMTREAFLEWEERQPVRYEFDGVSARAMTGGSANHARVQRNLLAALGVRLRGGRYEAFGSELKVLAAGSVRYPDAFIVCSPVSGKATSVADPVVVFEIINPSTSGIDRITKNQEYRDAPSIQHYVILEQDRQAATVFSRHGDDWIGHVIVGETDLDMPEVSVSLPLADLYAGVELVVDTVEPEA
ncbi:MAG: Uma2 family endonuclease [Acetobacteraceae bacterium]|nr:Uma2 family endonuclease [Pseudomonadota bacterium]